MDITWSWEVSIERKEMWVFCKDKVEAKPLNTKKIRNATYFPSKMCVSSRLRLPVINDAPGVKDVRKERDFCDFWERIVLKGS